MLASQGQCGEHTWGGDTKRFMNRLRRGPAGSGADVSRGTGGDYANWSNKQFEAARASGEFDDMVGTWIEQRDWCITFPLQALDLGDAGTQALASRIRKELSALRQPAAVLDSSLTAAAKVSVNGWTVEVDAECRITALSRDGAGWASTKHPIFELAYQVRSHLRPPRLLTWRRRLTATTT